MSIFSKAAAGLAAAALFTLPAIAADPASQPQGVRTVAFSDLNLETENGRLELQRRLVRAAKSICATNPVLESSAIRAERERCETETAAQFDAQIAAAIQANRARAEAYASR
ncbi:UrcA family protein [Sandaracinobacter sp. RS1-74]|uniref:UrcA family protein n=1 Tax=Sandaracinobacteroides sayramensis TaxID=2913411 RepID=UPI001EDC1813|nr:UrcA family protein [Sandaracinobacteroides sayramensis]MCG2839382.1 UrcA family protein [Sandaracinobacteroides sayramensis]